MMSFSSYYYPSEYYGYISTYCSNCDKEVEFEDALIKGNWYEEECPTCKKIIDGYAE